MELVVISGFLGSGKTTLLLALAKHLGAQGRKVAVIENEVGQDGIDGELLKAEGLSVREIYSGCICCSLRQDLIQTLLELEREYAPDVVFLEPSGVAGPKQIQHALAGYGGEIDSKTMIVVADAKRLPAIQDFSMPLIHDGLEIADLVVVNKVDLVSESEREALQERIATVNPDATQLCVSAQQGQGVDALLAAVSSRTAAGRSPPDVTNDHAEADAMPDAAIYADTFEFESATANTAALVEASLHQLGLMLGREAGVLVGHLKAIVKTVPLGYAVFSVTEPGQRAARKGALPDTIAQSKVILNSIVYGMEPARFKARCEAHFAELVVALSEDGA